MAKNSITDFSTTAASNTDVGGVDIQGTAPASNMDDSVREVMSILADTNAGTAPWADTMTIGDAADLTKEVRFELSNITAGQTRILTVPDSNGTIMTSAANPTLASLEGLTLAQGTTLYATAADTLAALAKGTAGQFYVMNAGATAPEWASRPTLVSLEGLSLAAGDTLYATAADTLARLAKGTALQVLTMNSGATAPEWATPIFSKSYESAEQTITAAGALSLTHSLGAQPKVVQAYLICKTAEIGYSIGDEVLLNPHSNPSNSGASFGQVLTTNSSTIEVRFGASGYILMNKGTGVAANVTNGSWRLIVRAWA